MTQVCPSENFISWPESCIQGGAYDSTGQSDLSGGAIEEDFFSAGPAYWEDRSGGLQ